MSSLVVLACFVALLGGVPAVGVLCLWWHGHRQETRCQRGRHKWGAWEVRSLGASTVLGARNVQVSVCERGCGATVRRLTAPADLWERNSALAERLFREAGRC